MRRRLPEIERRCGRVLRVGALALCAAATGWTAAGCAVSESDVHRWESTENGPGKLYAIVTHDKFTWSLRDEAALSLVRVRPRNGKRIGIEYVGDALSQLADEPRRHIVDDIAPKLIEEVERPVPRSSDPNVIPADPSIPFKDAAFSLLVHEQPQLVGNEKTKADLIAALSQWVQADFENRIDNSTQQFGVEQIMRFNGASAVKTLPSVITESSTKVDRACSLMADIGDDDTKKRASEALVALGKKIDSSEWTDRQRVLVNQANVNAKLTPKPEQVAEQLKQYQEQELEKVFTNMKRVGGRPAVEYCLAYAHDKGKSEKMRTDALAALENRMDKNAAGDVNTIFDIVKDDTNPDKVRGVAMARMGELPKDMILPRLYSLFDKKWKVRLDAARMILRTITTKELPDFLRRLPSSDKTKLALSEPITYGSVIMAMDPQGGPKPRAVLTGFLEAKELGAKLTAAGSYYSGKRSDAAALNVLENDKTPVPKCAPEDECGWNCDVNKETKAVTNVGEFVKYCIQPSLTP
jgi:hypothetical protein